MVSCCHTARRQDGSRFLRPSVASPRSTTSNTSAGTSSHPGAALASVNDRSRAPDASAAPPPKTLEREAPDDSLQNLSIRKSEGISVSPAATRRIPS